MKVAFVHKGYEDLGIEALSAYLKRQGHEVSLFYDGSVFSSNVGLNNELLARLFDPNSTTLEQQIVDGVVGFQPDIVGFSCVTATYRWSLRLAKLIKERLAVPTVFGGAHPSAVPARVVARPEVDAVVVGEGEEAFAELLTTLDKGRFSRFDVANVAYLRPTGPLINPCRPYMADLDSLPFADKDLFNDKVDVFYRYYMIMSGRGCPFACTYCGQSVYHERYGEASTHVRRRSVEHVVSELEEARQGHDLRFVSFRDDVFTIDQEWLASFAEEYPKRVGVPFFCYAHPRTLSAEVIASLAAAGCQQVKIGIQSFSAEICRKVLGRPAPGEDLDSAVAALQAAGVQVLMDHLLGLPGEDEHYLESQVERYIELKPHSISSFYLVYFPGTAIVEQAKRSAVISAEDVEQIQEGLFPAEAGYPSKEVQQQRAPQLAFQYYLDLLPLLPRAVSRWLLRHRVLHRLPYHSLIRQFMLVLHDVILRDVRLRYYWWYLWARRRFP